MTSPREKFLRDNIPPLPADVVVGRCSHTCITRVNMGVKDPRKIGMRYHFCAICKLKFQHDLEPHSVETQQLLRDLLTMWDLENKAKRLRQRDVGGSITKATPPPTTAKRAIAPKRTFMAGGESDPEIVDGPSPISSKRMTSKVGTSSNPIVVLSDNSDSELSSPLKRKRTSNPSPTPRKLKRAAEQFDM